VETRTGITKAVIDLLQWAPCQEGDVAPFKVAKIGVGIGKTEVAITLIVDAAAQGKRAVYLVPTHKLGSELLSRIEAEMRRRGVYR